MSKPTREQVIAFIEAVDLEMSEEKQRHAAEMARLWASRSSLTGSLRSTDQERTSFPFVPRDVPRDEHDRPKPPLFSGAITPGGGAFQFRKPWREEQASYEGRGPVQLGADRFLRQRYGSAQSVSDVIGAEYLAWYVEQGLLWFWRTADWVATRHLIVEPAEPHELKLRCSTRLPGLDTGLLSRQTSLGPTTSSMVMCRECAGLVNTQLAVQSRPLRRPATTDIPVRVAWREVVNLLDGERLLWVKHQELPRVLHVEQDMLARSEAIEDATDCGLADHHDGREYPVPLTDQRITPLREGTYPQRLDELVYVCTRCLARLHDSVYA